MILDWLDSIVMERRTSLSATTPIQTTFSISASSGVDQLNSVAIDDVSGDIIVTGSADFNNSDLIVARFDSDGTFDATFAGGMGIATIETGGSDVGQTVRILDDRSILIGGTNNTAFSSSEDEDFVLVKLTQDGELDTDFGDAGIITVDLGGNDDELGDFIVQDDGRIVIVGTTTALGQNQTDLVVIRYEANGLALDPSFGDAGVTRIPIVGTNETGVGVALQDDGKIVVTGESDGSDVIVVRLNTSGDPDNSFDSDGISILDLGGTDVASDIAIGADGGILIAGTSDVSGGDDFTLLKVDQDGSLDTSFDPDTNTLDGNPTFIENGSPVFLDENVEIFDAELSALDNFNGATLSLSPIPNSVDHVLGLDGTPFTLGQPIAVSGVTIGVAGSGGSGTQPFFFNSSATNELVNQFMQLITYENTSNDPPATVNVLWVFSDGNSGDQGTGAALFASGNTIVNITPVEGNEPPEITNLDGDVVNVTAGGPRVLLDAGSAALVSDVDSGDFDGGRLTATINPSVISDDGLSVLATGVGAGQISISGSTVLYEGNPIGSFGAIIDASTPSSALGFDLNSDADAEAVSALVRAIAYQNTNSSAESATRTVDFVLTDGDGGTSAVSSVTVNVAANVAPDSISTTSSFIEDTTTEITVSGTDDDGTVAEIRIVSLPDPAHGALFLDADGSNPVSGGSTYATTDGSLTLFFVPVANFNGDTSFDFAAIDDQGRQDTTAGRHSLEGTAVNDAPVLDNTGRNTLTPIDEDNFTSAGDTVASIIASAGNPDAITDVDADAVEGIAIYAADSTNGTWEYLSNDGITWTAFGTPSATAALLLTEETLVRFVPDADFNGDATFSYRAWDQTTGDQGDSISLTNNTGGTGSLSVRLDTARITVNPVNDDPVAVDDVGYTTLEDTPLTILSSELLANDSDIDGDTLGISLVSAPNGTNSFSGFGANSMITYTPNENFVGVETITYTLTDRKGGTDTATIEITVGSVNDAPELTGGMVNNLTVNEDSGFTSLGLTGLTHSPGGGVDETSQTLTYEVTVVPSPASGSVYLADQTTVVTTGTYTLAEIQGMEFRPAAEQSGTTFFEFRVVDDGGTANGGEDTLSHSIQITVNGDNDAPTAVDDSFNFVEDSTLTPTLGVDDLLQNDSDLEGDTLTVNTTPISGPSNGSLTLEADGTFTYTPNLDFSGTDSFVYEINDGNGGIDQATVDITVEARNDAPELVNGFNAALSVSEDSGLNSLGLESASYSAGGGADEASQSLSVNVTSVPAGLGTIYLADGVSVVTPGIYSVAQLQGMQFEPGDNVVGSGVFEFEVVDDGGTANAGEFDTLTQQITIDVTPVNDTPTASGPANLTAREQSSLRIDGTGFTVGDIDSDMSDIEVVFNVTEGIIFTSFGDSGVAVSNDAGTTTITGTATEISNLLAGSTTGFVIYQNNSDSPSSTATLTMTVNDLGNTGADPGLTGDNASEIATTTTTINITPVNDAPTLTLSRISVDEGSTNNILTNEELIGADVDDAPSDLTYRLISTPSEGLLGFDNGSVPVVLSVNDTFTQADVDSGKIFYTHSGSEAATDSFDLEFYDGGEDGAATRSGTFEIAINQANDAPTAVNDNFTVAEDGTLTPTLGVDDLLQNDSDPDGDTLTVNTTPVSGPANGSLTLGTDGTFTYTPNVDFNGVDSFTYEISDANGVTAEAIVEIVVDSVNDAPTTSLVTLTPIAEDSGIRVITQAELLANTSDVEGDTLTATGLTITSGNGTLVDNGNGTWNYTPAANDDSEVSFSYTVTDGTDSVAGSAALDITPVNDAPVAVNDFNFMTPEDTPITIAFSDLLANDSDADGDTLQINAFVGVTNGTVQSNGDQTYTFTPDANFSGVASFDYIVNDGNNATDRGTVEIIVGSTNDNPLAVDDEFTIFEDTSVTILPSDLLANDSDPDGDTPQFVAVDANSPTDGTLQVNGDGSFTYTPNANFFGTDSFTYGISDGNGGTAQATVNITVNSVNDAPTISPVTLKPILEDSGTVTITQDDLLVGSNDVDGDTLSAIGLTIISGSGTLVDNLDGTWNYTPAANDDSDVSFSYGVTDEDATVANTATLDITPVNDAPVAANDSFVTSEDNSLRISTSDLLANDSDVDGDALTVNFTPVSGPTNGTLSVNSVGSLLLHARCRLQRHRFVYL